MAATCRPITKAAPMMAASTCAVSRVRFGPMMRNSATVTATATAVPGRVMGLLSRHSGAEPTGPARSGRPDGKLREEPGIHNPDRK
jgi:hypothetical protein